MSFIDYVIDNNLGLIDRKSSFKEITTIGCGGNIDILYTPNDIESLTKVYKYICNNNLKYFIIGNGSNVLGSDNDYNGIVINLKKMPTYMKINENTVVVSAFYPTVLLAYDLANKGLGDLSFLGGIPGLLGGAIYNNSGAYNDNISNYVLKVKYINTSGNIIEIDNKMCAFGYRNSIFHYIKGIIIEVMLKVEKVETLEKLKERKKRRMLSQPLEAKSMGSVFKNNPLIPAWKIIDALHLRGFQLGDAAVSVKHTNFIINVGNCSSNDILNIISLIKTRSKLEFGIELESEITII